MKDDNYFYINDYSGYWIGNKKIKRLLESKVYTKESTGLDKHFSGFHEDFYPVSLCFIRKYNGVLEYAGIQESRSYYSNYQLVYYADLKYNFNDFDWICIYGADLPPTKLLMSNFNFRSFSTSYMNPIYNTNQFNELFSPTNKNKDDIITFGDGKCTVFPTLAYNQNEVNYLQTLKYKNENIFTYESNKIGYYGHVGSYTREIAYKYSMKNLDMFEYHTYANKPDFQINDNHDCPKHLLVKESIPITDIFKKYKYLIDIGGGSGFMGRLIYLINSNRVLFYTKPERIFCSYADYFLHKDINAFITLDIQLSSMREQYNLLENNNDIYEKYKNKLRNLADMYFTYDALLDYVYKIFKYSNVV